MGHHKQQLGKSNGFTIVELLIVVVVIAILAAITIVAFNGISQRAKASSAQSASSSATKKVLSYATINAEQYPSDLATADVSNSGDTSYQYSVNNSVIPRTFCITTTHSNSISYYQSSVVSSPTLGACAGHGANGVAPITNLVNNPSVETNTTGWSLAINGTVASQSATAALFGANGVTATAPANNVDSGVSMPAPGTFSTSSSYTASVSVRAITAGTYSLSIQGTGGSTSRDTRVLAAGTTTRFSFTWTPTTTGAIVFYVLRQGGQAGTHTFYVDGAMVTTGSSTPGYADGNSPGWAWTGTQHNSTSTGPPL